MPTITPILRAWPGLSWTARLLGISPSTLTRAMDADGVTKHVYGRRDKKISPSDALDYARRYNVDVNELAEKITERAEKSGASKEQVSAVEQEISAWLIAALRQTERDDPQKRLSALTKAVNELASSELKRAILARAGLSDAR